MGEEGAITYEIIFEILRKEKNNPDLQKLDDKFFSQVINYIKEKKAMLANKKSHLNSFGHSGDNELNNIHRILKELYERRERKIITLALNKSRTKSTVVNFSNMLNIEKDFYKNILEILNRTREGILMNLLSEKMPVLDFDKLMNDPKQEKTMEDHEEDAKSIQFVKDVEKFVGPELEVYGPYKGNDKAMLPSNVAVILIDKGVAREAEE